MMDFWMRVGEIFQQFFFFHSNYCVHLWFLIPIIVLYCLLLDAEAVLIFFIVCLCFLFVIELILNGRVTDFRFWVQYKAALLVRRLSYPLPAVSASHLCRYFPSDFVLIGSMSECVQKLSAGFSFLLFPSLGDPIGYRRIHCPLGWW